MLSHLEPDFLPRMLHEAVARPLRLEETPVREWQASALSASVPATVDTKSAQSKPGSGCSKKLQPKKRGPLPDWNTGFKGNRELQRDRLLDRGGVALHDYELLEMLLFFSNPKGNTKPLAKALITLFGSFANVVAAPQQALVGPAGLDRRSVAALKLVQESAFRMLRAEVLDQPVLNCWDRLMEYLNAVMAREKIEQFRILFLDAKHRLLADEAQARGTVNHAPVYPREVVKRALELHATALILVHNHPSGDPAPSRDDISMTREVKAAASVLSITLHDHIIVGTGGWLSFRAEGLL